MRGPGLFWLIPLGVENQTRIDLRVVTAPIEQQETITRDSVTVKVNAVLWYRVSDPQKAVLNVENFRAAVLQVALTSLRNVIGQHDLDEVLKARDQINAILSGNVTDNITPWGVCRMSRENPTWGAPRIHGELLKLGIDIGETSVSKYMRRPRNPPSQTWRTFLENHTRDLVSIDFFTVPTIRFQILYVFLVLAHHRRRIVHFAFTAHPTAEWTAHQLLQAFPWDSAPRYLVRDRDRIFGSEFVQQVKVMGIEQVLSTPASPWQRAYVERVIGTIRRECVDHVIVFNPTCLSRHLESFIEYYHHTRCHLALNKDAPEARPVQPPERGRVISIPQVGGLHHRYERRAA